MRPNLNPTVFDDPDRHPDAPKRQWNLHPEVWVKRIFGAIAFVGRLTWRVLKMRLIHRHPSPSQRNMPLGMLAAVVFRVMFLFVLVLGTVVIHVHLLNFPPGRPAPGLPATGGVLANPISLKSSDGEDLTAYLAPAVDEKQILKHREIAVRATWPAVVLVPDQRGDGHDLDPLIRPLHDRGYVVLLLRLRGGMSAQTMGLREKLDVAAAVNQLRSIPFVDRKRVAVLATGTGATAALLAHKDDPAIDRVIVYNPVPNFDEVLKENVSASWIRPLCRWAFEITNRVEVGDLDLTEIFKSGNAGALILEEHPARPSQRTVIAGYLQFQSPQEMSTAR